MELHERLVAARKHAKFETAVDAAAALGVPYPTYAGHENGSSGFRADKGELYARRFRVRFEWLMAGRGAMIDETGGAAGYVPLMGYVGAGAEVEPDFEQVPPDGLDQIHVPIALPADMIAFQVRGDSMLPQFSDGMVIIVFREQRRALETFYGEQAIVRTDDGRRFIKTIERGVSGVNLTSWNARTIENVRLAWIGEIFTFFPASAIRREGNRTHRQGGLQGRLQLKSA